MRLRYMHLYESVNIHIHCLDVPALHFTDVLVMTCRVYTRENQENGQLTHTSTADVRILAILGNPRRLDMFLHVIGILLIIIWRILSLYAAGATVAPVASVAVVANVTAVAVDDTVVVV